MDKKGNIVVTGKSHLWETWFDIATIKYAPDGSRIWERRFGSEYGWSDEGTVVATDSEDNVIVAGMNFNPHWSPAYDGNYMIVKYDSAGNMLWNKRFEHSFIYINEIRAMALDAADNIYVTGKSSTGFATYKLDKNGNQLWVARLEGVGNNEGQGQGEGAVALALDQQGNCVVTGTNNADYVTIKYNPDGNQLWLRRYNGPANGTDRSRHLGVDRSGNIYVTGQSQGVGTGYDMATLKYAPDGTQQWVIRYNGEANRDDNAAALAVVGDGELYVTGSSTENNNQLRFTTIRYSEKKTLQVNRFYLVDAFTNTVVKQMEDRDSFNIAAFRGQKVNIMATVGNVSAGSLVLQLSGKQTIRKVENIAPYALLGNKGNDYYSWRPEPGDYTLTATPYTGRNGKGTAGTPLTIRFRVLDSLTLERFALVRSDINSFAGWLQDGSIIDLAQTPAINIKVSRGIGYTESVRFGLNNNTQYNTENRPPFALASDQQGDYHNWEVTPGNYTITATPYGFNDAQGKAGTPLVLHITVVHTKPQAVPTSITAKPADKEPEKMVPVWVAPNPAQTFVQIHYRLAAGTTGSIRLFNQNGALVQEVYRGWLEGKTPQTLRVQTAALPAGTYYVQLIPATGGVQTTRFVKQ